jgi:hypothetical protein
MVCHFVRGARHCERKQLSSAAAASVRISIFVRICMTPCRMSECRAADRAAACALERQWCASAWSLPLGPTACARVACIQVPHAQCADSAARGPRSRGSRVAARRSISRIARGDRIRDIYMTHGLKIDIKYAYSVLRFAVVPARGARATGTDEARAERLDRSYTAILRLMHGLMLILLPGPSVRPFSFHPSVPSADSLDTAAPAALHPTPPPVSKYQKK